MSLRRTFAAALCLVAGFAGSVAWAQDNKKEPNMGATAATTASAAAVDSLVTAAGLARYGQANKDALALITAARMVQAAGSSASTAARVDGAPIPQATKPDGLAVEALLAQARSFAEGRKDLLALADDVAQAGSRGAVNGPGSIRTVVKSRAVDVYRVTFRGGEPARVLASGDGDSDLDLYVYDENDNLVCKDDDSTDDMVCRWSPRWTGSFTIRVRNRGVANEYRLIHN